MASSFPQASRLLRAATFGGLPGRLARRLDRLSEGRFALLAFLPGALLVVVIVFPPIITALVSSLFRYELLKTNAHPFIGLGNYRATFADPDFRHAVPLTALFALATTALALPIALATALILRRSFPGSRFLSICVLLPWAVSGAVTGTYWKFIFNSSFGLVNGIAIALGLIHTPVAWLENTRLAVVVAIIATVWRSVPLLALLILAALKGVPQSLYKAAKLDGANTWQSFRWITLPAIAPTLFVVVILQIITAIQTFDVLFTLTAGGPGNATTVVGLVVYQRAVRDLSLGVAAAMAVVIALATAVIGSSLFILNAVNRRRQRLSGAAEAGDEDIATSLAAATALRADSQRTEQNARRMRFAAARRAVTHRAGRVGLALGAIVLFVWYLGPILWILISSVQPEYAIAQAPPHLTAHLQFAHYRTLLSDPTWQHAMWVSLQVAGLTTLIALVVGVLAAYPLARYRVAGRGVIMSVIVATLLLPPIVLVIPTLIIARAVHLVDTVTILVLVNVAFTLPLVVWLLSGFFRGVPRSLEQAARIDGCSRLGTIFRITVRSAAPGIAAVAILLLIGTWNEFLFALILGDFHAVTVTRTIAFLPSFGGPGGAPPYTLLAAAGIVAVAPCVVLVSIFNRWVVRGLTEGWGKF